MRRLVPILLTLAMLLGSAGEVWSANYQKGQEAFLKKDYATTLREWKPLAEQENTEPSLIWVRCTTTDVVFHRTIRLQ